MTSSFILIVIKVVVDVVDCRFVLNKKWKAVWLQDRMTHFSCNLKPLEREVMTMVVMVMMLMMMMMMMITRVKVIW